MPEMKGTRLRHQYDNRGMGASNTRSIDEYGIEEVIELMETINENGKLEIYPLVVSFLNMLKTSEFGSFETRKLGFPLLQFSGHFVKRERQTTIPPIFMVNASIARRKRRGWGCKFEYPKLGFGFYKPRNGDSPNSNYFDHTHGYLADDRELMKELINSSGAYPITLMTISALMRDIEWIKGYVRDRDFFMYHYRGNVTINTMMYPMLLLPPFHHYCVYNLGINFKSADTKQNEEIKFEGLCARCQYYRRFGAKGGLQCPVKVIVDNVELLNNNEGALSLPDALGRLDENIKGYFDRMLDISQANLKKILFNPVTAEIDAVSDFREIFLLANKGGIYF